MDVRVNYLAIVPTLHVEDVWIRVLPHLLKGKEHWEQFYSAEQIRRNLILGRQQLWVMVEGSEVLGIVITQIDQFPEVKSLRILFLGGEGFKRNMTREILKIEQWAREKNVTVVDILGRPEWELLLKPLGYSSPGKVYRKDLSL